MRLLSTIAVFVLFLTSSLHAELYQIDATQSKIEFKIRHFVGQASGRFTRFSGTLDLNAKNLEDSRVSASIEVDSIDTGNEGRDKHLRNPDFFEVEKFPYLYFVSQKITLNAEGGSGKVTGLLTMHGVTREVVLDVTRLEPTLFEAKGMLNRKDFGINYSPGPSLGDEVEIEMSIRVAPR